jgi:4-amino-4-deoxy-L-arabinose transferase-like glycosyltransferase
VSAATRPGDDGAVTPGQVLAGLLLAAVVVWLLAPFAGVDPPAGLTASNAPWTDEGFNLAGARERVLAGHFATGDVDRSLTNGAYSALVAGMFTVTGPSLAAGRALSMVAVAAAVLLLALGLARPLGRPAALLAAAALGGANLVLEHGRLALVEATVLALLAGAFVLAARAAWRPSTAAGAGLGLLVAAAVSVKAIALLPGMVMLAVVLVAAAARRDRAALAMGLAGLATVLLAGAAWLVAVALPNWERFRTAVAIWPRVDYLDSPAALAGRLGRYLADSDQALGRSLPLLLAAAIGLAALARRWPRLPSAARDALVMAALWGVGLWLAVAVADYLPGHYGAPNRYVVPALPGLAVLAGFGLADLAALAGRARAGWPRLAGLVGVALGLAVAVPGVVGYLDGATASGRSREQGQRTLAASLPTDAVVYGAYAPTLLFDTRLAARTPWPGADANVRDPVGRLGVTHVLVGDGPADPTSRVPTLAVRDPAAVLARVPWGPGELVLYSLSPTAGVGVSPVAAPIDYDPQAGPSRQP